MKSTSLLIRTLLASICCLPFFLIFLGIPISLGLQAVLATFIQFFCGWPFYVQAWKGLKKLSMNEDALIVIGISGAYLFGFYLLWIEPKNKMHFEMSSVLTTCILFGRWLRVQLVHRAENGMNTYLSMQPRIARVKREDTFIQIPIEKMELGDQFCVESGERIPADGEIIEGASVVDESLFSRERISVEKQKGNFVFAGTINEHGTFTAIVQKIGKNTALGQMIYFVEEATKTEVSFDRFPKVISSYFIPAVFIFAALTGVGWWFFANNLQQGSLSALSLLIIVSPYALANAVSLVMKVTCGKAAKMGILIKHADGLEKAAKIKRLVFDKDNTITEAALKVEKVELNEEYYFPIVNTLCKHSEHPASKSILEFLKNKSFISLRMLALRPTAARGVSGHFDGRNYYLGSLSFLEEHNIQGEVFREAIAKESGMIVGVATEKLALGYFVLSEQTRPESKTVIEKIKKMGIETVLLTEKRLDVAKKVADELDVDFYEAQVLPQQKAYYVENARIEGELIGMIGDGIKDKEALTAADIGFAIRSGTELDMEAAAFGLMNPHIKSAWQAIVLSKTTCKKMKQNLFFVLAYHAIAIPLAVLGLLNPFIATLIGIGGSLVILTNALFLFKNGIGD